jgi:ribonuclease BN (tRNA processing enzyme)
LKRSVEILNSAKITFDPPDFGITFLGSSNGFDPVDSTSGFIVWINQKGILVDPPTFSTDALLKIGIPPSMIDKIILTHVHADHDSGIFQKILSSTATEIITTPTIMGSFVRKYSAIIGISPEDLRRLFQFRPVTLNHSLTLYGATFQFFYSFHSIPCIGFKVFHGEESIYYTGDTFYDAAKLNELHQKGLFSKERLQELTERDLENYSYILHEAGGAPIHTTIEVLRAFPKEVKEKMILYHIPTKQIPSDSGLTKAECGLSNTLVTSTQVGHHQRSG